MESGAGESGWKELKVKERGREWKKGYIAWPMN